MLNLFEFKSLFYYIVDDVFFKIVASRTTLIEVLHFVQFGFDGNDFIY